MARYDFGMYVAISFQWVLCENCIGGVSVCGDTKSMAILREN